MKISLLEILRCPVTGQKLHVENEQHISGDEVVDGFLLSEDEVHKYRITNHIVRFVPEENYADNFGMQWNHFRKTQLDSFSGQSISSDRFWNATGWRPDEIKDKWVLDAGCGSGRFAEAALIAGARVVAVDYSSAVDACYDNLKHYPNLYVVQGDIYSLPFQSDFFPFVYSLGVLQHTPDVEKSFISLIKVLMKGGSICVDFYWKRLQTMLHMKYLLRPITKKIDHRRMFNIVSKVVPKLLPISNALIRIPLIGKPLSRFIPVANYSTSFGLSKVQQLQWSILDTWDWFSPRYDNPQNVRTIQSWCEQNKLQNIQIFHHGHLVAKGKKI
jgi:SAM-dependent methyltransferase